MTHQEKEALLKRIYALPTGWADGGGSYGEGGPVGSEDAAMLWPEAVIDAINQFAADANVARSPWVKTSDRLPDAEQIARNDKIFLLCKQHDGTYEAYTHWADGLASHPEKFEFDYWMPVPPLPEVEGRTN